MANQNCKSGKDEWNPFTLAYWQCAWQDVASLSNPVVYPKPDIATPPYVTKAPPSATQAPYNVSQTDINATIAQVWADWVPGAIGANTAWNNGGEFERPPIDWPMLGLIGVGIFLVTRTVSKGR